MNDRELLENAAKAAGMDLMDRPEVHCYVGGLMTTTGHWSPLTDDGDALRLVVNLRLSINFDHEPLVPEDSRLAETRRAIVRAAAEIGRAMK